MIDLPQGAQGVIGAINSTPTAAASSRSAVEISTVGIGFVGVQITGTYTASGGLSGQVSVDGLTWVTLGDAGTFTRQSTGAATATVTSGEQDIYVVPVKGAKKFRITALGAVTGTAQISMQAADMGSGGGSSGGGTVDTVVAGSGISVDATDPANPIVSATGSGAAAVVLGAGPTAITHDDHSNRAVSSVQAAATSVVFAVTATSGAVDGDLVTITNLGLGRMTASGAIEAPRNFKLWAGKGETLIAEYNAAADKYYSRTPDVRRPGTEPSFSIAPQSGATTISSTSATSAFLDSSTAGTTISGATAYSHHPRTVITGAGSAAGDFAGINITSASAPMRQPTASIPYGWKVRVVGGIADAIAAGSFAMGISGATVNGSEPSTFQNCILLGGDSDMPNLAVMHNDGAGNCTEVDLGASFPNHTNAADYYEFMVEAYADGTARFYRWTARNLVTFAEASGTIDPAGNAPAEGNAAGVFLVRCNQAVLTTPACAFGGFFGGLFA